MRPREVMSGRYTGSGDVTGAVVAPSKESASMEISGSIQNQWG